MRKLFSAILFFSIGLSLCAQTPELVIPIGHTATVNVLAFSPDGQFVLTGSEDGATKLWDRKGRELQTFKQDNSGITALAISADNQQLVTGNDRGAVRLWDLKSANSRSFSAHNGRVKALAFSPDGQFFLSGGRDGTAKLWNVADSQARQTFSDHTKAIPSVAFSPDGQSILTGSWDHTAKLWGLDGQLKQTFSGHEDRVISAAFSSDGKFVLTGSIDGTAKLWRLNSREKQIFVGDKERGDANFILSTGLSSDGGSVLACDVSGNLHTWNLKKGNEQAFARLPTGIITSAVFAPDGQSVLTYEFNGEVKLWSLDGQLEQVFTKHADKINALAYAPDGQSVLIAQADGTASLWDLTEGGRLPVTGHTAAVTAAAFSLDGQLLLTGSRDSTAKLWSLDGKLQQTFSGHRGTVHSVAFAPDGQSVLTGSADSTLKRWNIGGEPLQTYTGHDNEVLSVAFSPDGKTVLSSSEDRTAKLWQLNGSLRHTFSGHRGRVNTAVFSPKGDTVLTSSRGGTVKQWDAASGKELHSFSDFVQMPGSPIRMPARFNSAIFMPKGDGILACEVGNTAKLWSVDGQQQLTFQGHTDIINGLAISPDGKTVITGGWDRTAKLWDAQTGTLLATLVALDSADWAVTTPTGLFDASPGAMNLMHFVQGLEVVALKQLENRYYEPGVLPKALGLASGGLRPVGTFDELDLYPAITEAVIEGDVLRVQLEKRQGGIGKVELFIGDQVRGANVNPDTAASFEVDLKEYARFLLPDTANALSLRTYNRGGWLKSEHYHLTYPPDEVRARGRQNRITSLLRSRDEALEGIHLYALVVGTAVYSGEHLNLKYPSKDAIAFAEALRSVGQPLFGNNVKITLLTTEQQPWPRKAEIEQALAEIAAKAKPADLLLVYLSGHGITYPAGSEESRFHYLTTDIKDDVLNDPVVRATQAISQDTLQAWMRQVPARKSILILDACNSGQVVESLFTGEKSLDSDRRRALKVMNDISGAFILAGSAADKSSYEATNYGHGLLTYSLLNSMPKVAAASQGQVKVSELFNVVKTEVPELAKEVRQLQQPQLVGTATYPIGLIEGDAPYPLPKALPVFLRPSFTQRGRGRDLQQLGKAVSQVLDRSSAGGQPQLAFWGSVDEFTGDHYLLSGEYQSEGGRISGQAFVWHKDKELAQFPFEGELGQPEQLAEDLVSRAWGFIKD